jgi:hypothetical protein
MRNPEFQRVAGEKGKVSLSIREIFAGSDTRCITQVPTQLLQHSDCLSDKPGNIDDVDGTDNRSAPALETSKQRCTATTSAMSTKERMGQDVNFLFNLTTFDAKKRDLR